MKRILLIVALSASGHAQADVCEGLTNMECLDYREGLKVERSSRLETYNPTITWQRSPYGKKFTYRPEQEGMTEEEESEMIRLEDERNGYE